MTNKILAIIAASLMATASYSAHANDSSTIKVPGSTDAGSASDTMGDVTESETMTDDDDVAADTGSGATATDDLASDSDATATDDLASDSDATATDDLASDTDAIDPDTTASIGQPNFGTVISSIRAGKSDLTGITPDAEVNVVDVSTLEGSDSQALENALTEKQSDIDSLRSELSAMDLQGVEEEEINKVVAVNTEADGSVTLFTYDDSM